MIENSTVLILGAGASIPYGMPSGVELRNEICLAAMNTGVLPGLLRTILGIDEGETIDFARQFKRSHVASIDAFLAKRTGLPEIGKLSIAAILAEREKPEKIDHASDAEHWYSYLWNILIQDVKHIDELKTNRIKFITFNYDRSLEYFLHLAIKNTFGVDDAKAEEVLRGFEILHVYGSLGNFHYLPGDGARQYSNDLNLETLRIAANAIEIIPEARDDSLSFTTAQDWCDRAEMIGFLGFGFDRLNILRLDLGAALEWKHANNKALPRIVASTFGVTGAEKERYREILCPHVNWETWSDNCLMTLRESTLFG